jgi:hypothetical protein
MTLAPEHARQLWSIEMADLLVRRAPVGPATLDRASRTVEATLSSGAAVSAPVLTAPTGAWIERLDLAGIDPRSLEGRPILRDHRPAIENIVGKIETARLEHGSLVAKIRFAQGEDVDALVADIEGGFVTSLSIGYSVGRWERTKNAT